MSIDIDALIDYGLGTATDRAGQGAARHPAYDDLTAFKFHMYRRYQHSDHLAMLDEHLTQVARYVESGGAEGVRFLVVEMPPRHGKSLTLARLFPAWFIGRNPDKRVMLATYGASLAHKHSRFARNLLLAPRYQEVFPGVRLMEGSQAVDAWDVDRDEGGMDALGVLGSATGKGAHILLNDDLMKNRQEAESLVIRDRTWDALMDDLMTRLEPSGAAILNATRWHQDDPTGRVLANFDPNSYVRLRLPALAEVGDRLGRAEGEALWPWRYPRDRLLEIQQRLGPYSWSALFQQNPVPAEGGVFKRAWFRVVAHLPHLARWVRFWDLAMSSKTSADWTVGTLMGEGEDGHFYILNVERAQKEWGDVVPWMAEIILRDGPDITQGLEEKGYMSRAVTDLNADPRLRSYQVWGYPKDTDKLTNALPFAAHAAADRIHLTPGHWVDTWLDEICSFTGSGDETDDQVDSAAGAYNMLSDGAGAEFGEVIRENDVIVGAYW